MHYPGYRQTSRQTIWPLSVLRSGALIIPLMGWSDPGYATPCQDLIALQATQCADLIAVFPGDNLGVTKETTVKPSTSLLPFKYLASAAQPSPELSPNFENATPPLLTSSDDSESAMSSQAADLYPVSTGIAAASLAGHAPIPNSARHCPKQQR